MALDSQSTPDDSVAPPSFIPAASRKRAGQSSDATASQPPSFTPSGSEASGKPAMPRNHEQTPVRGKQQETFAREPRRAGGSSRTLPAPNAQNYRQTPISYAPASNRSFSQDASSPAHGRSAKKDSRRGGSGRSGSSGSYSGGGHGSRNGGSSVAKRHRPGRIIAGVLLGLLAIALILAGMAYFWVNGQLQHFNGLTDAADDSSQTWLITGSDVRDGTAGTGKVGSVDGERTDSIMLLVKPKSGRSALISIPRDTYVTVDGTDMKINAVAETYGWKKLTAQVEQISGLKVDHLVRVGFSGVKDVVDAVGGVNLCYDQTVNDAYSGLKWTAGCHDADGTTALAFSRMRYSDPTGDIGRAKRQRQVIQAVAKKAASKEILLNYSKATKLVSTGLSAIKVDEDATPFSLVKMALAFKDATGSDGITGSPYFSDVNYYPSSGIGSTVKLNDEKTLSLFSQIAEGTHAKGTVGGLE